MMPVSKRVVSLVNCLRSKRLAYGSAFFNKFIQNNYSCTEWETNRDESVSNFRIKPQEVLPQAADLEIGKDMVGDILTEDVNKIVNQFLNRTELTDAVNNLGLDENMFEIVKESFTKYCNVTQNLPLSLYIIISDLTKGEGHVLDLLPYFTKHIYHVYPHLQYLEELKVIGDLQNPAQWFPLARSMKRKLFFHHGPTNSGKTYHALKRFMEAKTGVYCAPLKLLANEIFQKANEKGVQCDLLTGEEKKMVSSENIPADHISCTVEMADTNVTYEVAVIDEIQMLKCPNRGYAWTRALLGLAAEEIHLCGETSAINYIKEQAKRLNEKLECIKYERLTKLSLEKEAVKDLRNVLYGDCIVCFSKKDIFSICLKLDCLQIKFAVIYGTLPPATKNTQSSYFNNPKSGCKVLVATDAVGLGINLNIRRIIFYSLTKRKDLISVSQALQIAGRAGRYKSHYPEGYVTAFFEKDLPKLKSLLFSIPEELKQGGLFPTSEQIETYSYFLPGLQFNDLLDVFISLAKLNELYFICEVTQMRLLASQLENFNMDIRHKYLFCCAPVNKTQRSLALFTQFGKKFSMGRVISSTFMKIFLRWPPRKSANLHNLDVLEEAFDCLELYLWFGNRLPQIFPDNEEIIRMQAELEIIISASVKEIVKMAKAQGNEGLDSVGREIRSSKILTSSFLKEINSNVNKKSKDENSVNNE